MSTQTPAVEDAANEPVEPAADEQLGDAGKKALVAERDARKAAEKAAADLKAQLDAINAEQMSDLEKAQAAAETAAADAAEARREAMRFKYAAKHGISDEDAELFLTGETEDVVKAQAERLAVTASSKSGTPKPDLTQGGNGQPAPATPGEAFAEFIESKIS